MELKLKDVKIIIVGFILVTAVGYTYVAAENYVFGEVLPDYFPQAWILLLRVTWTAMLAKWFYNTITYRSSRFEPKNEGIRQKPVYENIDLD